MLSKNISTFLPDIDFFPTQPLLQCKRQLKLQCCAGFMYTLSPFLASWDLAGSEPAPWHLQPSGVVAMMALACCGAGVRRTPLTRAGTGT